MCLLGSLFPAISYLCAQPVALATIFAKALPHVLQLLLPAMHVCPFVATVVPSYHWICRPFLFFDMNLPAFCCHQCCRYLCPRHFFAIHVALNIATAIAIAITLALMVCHGYCHHV